MNPARPPIFTRVSRPRRRRSTFAVTAAAVAAVIAAVLIAIRIVLG